MKIEEKSEFNSEDAKKTPMKVVRTWLDMVTEPIAKSGVINNSPAMRKGKNRTWKMVTENEIKKIQALFSYGLNEKQLRKLTGRSWVTIKLILISKNLEHYKINMHEFWEKSRGRNAKKNSVLPASDTFVTPEDEEKFRKQHEAPIYETSEDKIKKIVESNLRMETVMHELIEKLNRFLKVFES